MNVWEINNCWTEFSSIVHIILNNSKVLIEFKLENVEAQSAIITRKYRLKCEFPVVLGNFPKYYRINVYEFAGNVQHCCIFSPSNKLSIIPQCTNRNSPSCQMMNRQKQERKTGSTVWTRCRFGAMVWGTSSMIWQQHAGLTISCCSSRKLSSLLSQVQPYSLDRSQMDWRHPLLDNYQTEPRLNGVSTILLFRTKKTMVRLRTNLRPVGLPTNLPELQKAFWEKWVGSCRDILVHCLPIAVQYRMGSTTDKPYESRAVLDMQQEKEGTDFAII